MTSARY